MDASTSSEQRAAAEPQAADPPPLVGQDERRMHVRAYNFWVSLLDGRPLPSTEALTPARLGGFAAHSVLIDGPDAVNGDARITWLGAALRDEAAVDGQLRSVAEVPTGSLLSELTTHCPQVIATRAPVGFEDELLNGRGRLLMYRGILLPFSTNGRDVDYVCGVINWKEVADPVLTRSIVADADRALAAVRAQPVAAPAWADGPSRSFAAAPRGFPDEPVNLLLGVGEGALLADTLAIARASAEGAAAAERRAVQALHRALAQAYAFALSADDAPDAYGALMVDQRIRSEPRSPMLPVVKLVFGAEYDRRRLAIYCAVLAHAWRMEVPPEAMASFLDETPGGLRAIAAAERAIRRAERDEDADG